MVSSFSAVLQACVAWIRPHFTVLGMALFPRMNQEMKRECGPLATLRAICHGSRPPEKESVAVPRA
jgi:hypothetical protein